MRGGSPAYSSMQVLTGEDPVPADDVFSLACLAYRLIAGYRVFGPRNAADAAQEGMEPQQPNELSGVQWAAMKKALAYSRVTRYESPKAFLDAFGMNGPGNGSGLSAQPSAMVAPGPQATANTKGPDIRIEAAMDRSAHDETTEVALDSPIRADHGSIMYEHDEPARRSPWRLLVVGIILVGAAFVVVETRVIDEIPDLETGLESLTNFVEQVVPDAASVGETIEELAALPEIDVADTSAASAEDGVTESLVIDSSASTVEEIVTAQPEQTESDSAAEVAISAPPVTEAPEVAETVTVEPALPPPVDFSVLPDPDLILTLGDPAAGVVAMGDLAIREGAGDVIVQFVRDGDQSRRFYHRIVEPSF